ncbi:SDR family oxidoreductase [Candidatus Woesearchaeota archaeon]|nr:MAG: SDR family oxidoreductase [Candidatus Woesearchaeota archaeon]
MSDAEMGKRVMITGIGGFVGPYLAGEMLRNGYEVCGTYFAEKPSIEGIPDSMLRAADITKKEEIRSALEEFQPDYVVHLAAMSDAGESFRNRELYNKVNVEGTRNIYEALSEAGLKAKVLLAGSSHEYGIPLKIPITEDHPLNPNNPYGESKVEAERVARQHPQIKTVFARSFNHTGPGQPPNFVLPSFAHQIAMIESGKQEPVIRVGNIDAKRDFLDVRDVVRAYRLLLQKGREGEAYNVCSGESHRISDLLVEMIGMSRADIKIMRDEEKLRPVDIPELRGDNSKLKGETGWQQEISIDETMRDLLDYWRKKVSEE